MGKERRSTLSLEASRTPTTRPPSLYLFLSLSLCLSVSQCLSLFLPHCLSLSRIFPGNASLLIWNVSQSQASYYDCILSNKHGSDNRTFFLIVVGETCTLLSLLIHSEFYSLSLSPSLSLWLQMHHFHLRSSVWLRKGLTM